MSARVLIVFLLLGLAMVAAGCNLALDPPTLVKTPRILAIVADPPEAAPGEDVDITVMAFDPMGRRLSYRFEVCIDPSAVLDSDMLASENVVCRPLVTEGLRTTVPGAFSSALVDAIPFLTPAQTGGFDPAVLLAIIDTAGLPIRVQVDVVAPDGQILVSGHKLIGITRRAAPTTNPPRPYLLVDGVPYIGGFSRDRPFDCITPFPETIAPGAFVHLFPGDPASEWVETFPIYDYTGGIHEGQENGYYSWFATGGGLPTETTQYPTSDTYWQAPMEEGLYRLWFVIRDGHLGASACTFELDVRAE